nr:15738_t:CDS:2 [Entrophospora candida]
MPSLEEQINKLEKILSINEAYINYLEKEITNRDEELEELEIIRKNNSDLQIRLKKALTDIEYKEESLLILDKRIYDLQQEIINLKNRIQNITSRKKKLAMARAPNANEIQTLGEAVRNAFNNINSILNRVPAIPRNIDGKFTDIRNAANRLQEISNWETNRANRAQAQIDQDAKTIKRLNATARIADEELSLMTRVYHNEKEARRNMQSLYNKKHRRVVELLREKFAAQLLCTNRRKKLQQKINTCQNDLFLSDIQIDTKWGKWKNRCRNSEQIIMNLNQNILNLQNNIANQPHMAAIHEIYQILHSPLSQIPNYIGKEPPDEYYQKIINVIDSINTIIVGFQDVIVIPALYTHLPPDLRSNVKMYMSIRGGNTTIDNFFADLKKCWLERQSGNNSIQPTLINQQPTLDILTNFAQRLGYSGNLADYNQMQKYIENDLYRRQVQNIKNEPFEPQRKLYATKQPASRKVIITNKNSRQCSICKKVGHTKINCPKVKRVRRLNNISQYENNENDENVEYFEYVEYDDEEIIDADNEEVILEDDENEYIDFEPQETNYENQVFLESIKYIISSLIPQCPKEILSEIYSFIRKLFPEMENTFHSYYTKNYSSKARDMVWKNLIKKYQFILVPLIYIINSHKESQESINDNRSLNHAIKLYQEAELIRDWPNPLEINFLQIKEPNNYATIPCKIYDLEIPHALLDTGSDGSHLSKNIADHIEKYFDLKLDKKKTYRLSGAVGEKQSIGTFHDIPITIGIGNDTLTISDEFSVLPTEKDHNGKDISLFILGTKWQHRAGWEPIVKGELKLLAMEKSLLFHFQFINLSKMFLARLA